jgi:hypothetical protein
VAVAGESRLEAEALERQGWPQQVTGESWSRARTVTALWAEKPV